MSIQSENLLFANQSQIIFADQKNVGSIGIQADATTQSYTLTLPNTAPNNGQVLGYNGNTDKLIWTQSNRFIDTQSLYVSKQGSDNNNGTQDNPVLTIKRAVQIANEIPGAIRIYIGPGTYIENNDIPLDMTDPVYLEGASTIIIPSNLEQYLFRVISCNVYFSKLTMTSQNGLGAISVSGNTNTNLSDVIISGFQTAIYTVGNNISSSTNNMIFNSSAVFNTNSVSTVTIEKGTFQNNNLALYGSSCSYVLNGCRSSSTLVSSSTGINITNLASVTMQSCIWVCFNTAVNVIGQNTTSNINHCYFYSNVNSIIANNSHITLSECVFTAGLGISIQSLNLAQVSCTFCVMDGKTSKNNGTGALCSQATLKFRGSIFRNLNIGFISGQTQDNENTLSMIDAAYFENNDKDLIQNGTTTLKIAYSSIDLYKVDINNAVNTDIIIRNLSSNANNLVGSSPTPILNSGLIIGKFSNVETYIMSIINSTNPRSTLTLSYFPNLYSYPSICWRNSQSTNFATSTIAKGHASHNVISESLAGTARLALLSDSTVFDTDSESYRGWFIQKRALTSQLDFIYTNKDAIAQNLVDRTTILTLDGIENIINIGTNKLLFDDIAVYKYNGGIKLDGAFILNSQTGLRVAGFDSGQRLISTNVSIADLNYVAGVKSNIQNQLNSKLSLTGGILTGSLITINGNLYDLALGIGSNSCGFISQYPNSLSVVTNNTERMTFEADGRIKLSYANGILGVLNNYITSTLVSTRDLQDRAITNEKLSTSSSLNNPNYVVVRDNSGNFATNMISILSEPINDTDVATKAYVDKYSALGIQVHMSVHVVCTENIACSDLPFIDNYQLRDADRILLIGQMNPYLNGIWTVRNNAWTRPNDFATGSSAQTTYVLVTNGLSAGSSWVCITPNAIIDTDTIKFAKFSLPIKYATGSNIGNGIGIYNSSSLNNLEFKSIGSNSNISITNSNDKIMLDVVATSNNTNNAIVSRDANGNFSANQITATLLGAASHNVLKTGDTMSGPLILPSSAEPMLTFANNYECGFSMYNRALNIMTNNIIRLKIDLDGNIFIPNMPDGIVHNSFGILRSSLIVNDDIDDQANIVDSKLDTIKTPGKVANEATSASSINTPNSIVLRDSLGNFTCNNILGSFTGTLNGLASMNLPITGGIMQGHLDMGNYKILNLKSLDLLEESIKIKNTTIKTNNLINTTYNIPNVSNNSNFVMESTANGTHIIESHETVSYITNTLLASSIASGIAVITNNALNITIDSGHNIASNAGLSAFKVGTTFKVLINNPTANNVRLIPSVGITLSADLILANTSRLLYFIVMGNNTYSVY